ncbi:hypothetical protein [Bacillus sp. SG-1]|uniref:hypothetical protein n=1 Tax=Bacillus sp. SG-1 TaxID=161544 RepID=UPI00069451F7|nr:hypothetical protein [Bacillus sp. SG-1]
MARITFCLLGIMLSFTSIASNTIATSWAYPFIVWQGHIYVVTEEPVIDIEMKIGEVTAFSDMQQLPANFSNEFSMGTKFYTIKNISTDNAIAVEVDNGIYHRADKKGIYGAKEPVVYNGKVSVMVLSILIVMLSIGIIMGLRNLRGI